MTQQSETASKFESYLGEVEAARARYGVPGVGVAILQDGVEYTAGLGVTNIHHPLRVDADTLFQIGSTTKTFTATLIMMLAEEGKIDLDAPVRTYLPDLKLEDEGAAANVTVRHLLIHHGGWIGDFFEDTGRGDDCLKKYAEKMVSLRQENPLDTVFAYNNAAFNLAGLVIAEVTGEVYETVLMKRLVEPLGMATTRIFPEDAIVHRTVSGHNTPIDGKPSIAEPWALPRSAFPAGGLLSTANDQLKYARFHLGNGTTVDGVRLLKQESVKAMQVTQRKAFSLTQEVGISWLIKNPAPGIRQVGHGGATTGQFSAFDMVPDRNFAIALTTNGSRGRAFNGVMVKRALELFLDARFPKPEVTKLSDDALAEYVGVYNAALATAEIAAHEGGLMVTSRGNALNEESDPPPPTPPGPFVFVGKDEILALEGTFEGGRGQFARDENGRIKWVHLGGRIYHRE